MKKTYLAPKLEILEVKTEKGFANSQVRHVDVDTSILNWESNGDIEYNGNAVKDNSDWGDVDW